MSYSGQLLDDGGDDDDNDAGWMRGSLKFVKHIDVRAWLLERLVAVATHSACLLSTGYPAAWIRRALVCKRGMVMSPSLVVSCVAAWLSDTRRPAGQPTQEGV